VLVSLFLSPVHAVAEPGALPVPDHSAAQAHAAAKEVLARGEYQVPSPTILQRIRIWIAEHLARVLGKLARGVTTDATSRVEGTMARLRTADDWRAEASTHEKQGQWRAGIRCRYRALVADLAQRGLVDEVPGRTTGEYRAEVGDNVPKIAPEFSGATELFEAAWYGNRPTGEHESARFRELADRVLVGAKS